MNKEKQWKQRWKNVVRATKVPGVWERKEGGHLVRARALDPTTGKMKEVKKVLPEADQSVCVQVAANGAGSGPQRHPLASPLQKPRFADYAVSLLERKLAKGNIKSAMGREKWLHTLEHLIKGTKGVLGFGEIFMHQIRCEQR